MFRCAAFDYRLILALAQQKVRALLTVLVCGVQCFMSSEYLAAGDQRALYLEMSNDRID
jgi:hypothetical protein